MMTDDDRQRRALTGQTLSGLGSQNDRYYGLLGFFFFLLTAVLWLSLGFFGFKA
jgi:hypothetical protein